VTHPPPGCLEKVAGQPGIEGEITHDDEQGNDAHGIVGNNTIRKKAYGSCGHLPPPEQDEADKAYQGGGKGYPHPQKHQ